MSLKGVLQMLRKSISIAVGTVLLSGLGALVVQPSYSQPAVIFECYANDGSGYPTTMARSAKGQISVVRWYSEYFSGSGYDPITRCQEVSGRFQSAYNSGRLDYITAGYVNGYPVVCATTAGGSCNEGNLLFTLKKGTDAAATLQRLFNVRDLGAGPLYESSGRTYIDVNKILEPLATGEGQTPQATPNNPTEGQPTETPSSPGGW
jgi:hypothetical protein